MDSGQTASGWSLSATWSRTLVAIFRGLPVALRNIDMWSLLRNG